MRHHLLVTPRILALILALATACAPAATPVKTTAPATPAPTPAPAATDAADLDARLAHLAGALEQARTSQHIPGMAVAVVRGDRVIFARGFGVRDLTTQEPVTPETLFPIGSSTKAFAATAVGMMVDDGKLSWDDPLSQHVPSLRLQVKAAAGEQASVRDALCHRTGFPRMGVLWGAGTLSLDEIFQHASRAIPTAALGEEFQYNNVTYCGAAEAGARAAGMPWEDLVRTRILAPLGMQRTYVSSREAEATGALAVGYTWYPDQNQHLRENLRDIAAMAAAGAIHSSVMDMTAWLRFQLGKGVFEGKRLIGETTLAETHEVQIPIQGLGGYGLGWFVRDWNGQRYIEHGGNIDGFSASVGFLPESDIGFVLLSNTTASLLQGVVGSMVFEALLGNAHLHSDEPDGEDHGPYVGVYLASFGPFQEEPFKVLVQNGKLAVDVPQQQVYELRPPDAQGRRKLAVAPEVAISFTRDDSGKVVAMHIHQHGLDFELPRQGLAPTRPVDAAAVAPGTAPAVTMDGIVALRRPEQRKRAAATMGHTVMEGKVHFPNAGIEGKLTVHFEGMDRYRQEIDLGKAGRMVQVVNGTSAWADSSFDQPEQLAGLRAAQARLTHPLAFAGDWRALFDTIELLGSETVDGKRLHVVSLRAGALPVWRAYLDPATGDVVKATGSEIHSFGTVPAASSFADHRAVRGIKGLRLPFQTTTALFQSGAMIITIERVRTGLPADATLYPSTLPAARPAGAPATAPEDGQ